MELTLNGKKIKASEGKSVLDVINDSKIYIPQLCKDPDMKPIDPFIHISVHDLEEGGSCVEWDIRTCKSFLKDEGRWMRLRPGEKVPT